MCGALATSWPCRSNTAQEKSSRSRILTELALCWLPRASLEPLLESHRSLSRGYLAATVARLQAQRHRAASLRGRSAVQRIAAWLAAQTPEIREAGAPVIRLRLSRRDLASLLDMSVETLCRGLHQVEERGAIRLLAPDVVMVMRPGRLCEVAGAPAECPADPDLARRG